jgi:hypothetical protein
VFGLGNLKRSIETLCRVDLHGFSDVGI